MPANFPDNPAIGQSFTVDGRTWTWNGATWDAVLVAPPLAFTASATAPSASLPGSGWFDTETGKFFVYYDNHWIEFGTNLTGPQGPEGPAGPPGADGTIGADGAPGRFIVSETEPTSAVEGDAWFDSTSSRTYIYFDNLWIEIIGATGPAGADGAPGANGADGSPTRSIRSVSDSTALQPGDLNQMIRFTGTSAQILTVEDVLSPGTSVEIIQDNSGSVEFQSGSGVTLLSSSGFFAAKGQNSVVTLRCVDSGQYRITGDVQANAVPKATGGTITETSQYFIHTFTSSGTFTPNTDISDVEYLVIAGGGGGGTNAGAGGGAGGYRSSVVGEMSGGGSTAENRLSLTSGTDYTVTVGAGGVGGQSATQGVTSVFGTVTTVGGGRGANGGAISMNGGGGGSGGGASAWLNQGSFRSGGAGTAEQGFAGGDSTSNNSNGFPAAGGGGAGGVGQSATASGAVNVSGLGGAGLTSSITGTAVTRASGATGQYSTVRTPGGGGAEGIAGDANTGGGGGSDSAGGSGIVIIRYPI